MNILYTIVYNSAICMSVWALLGASEEIASRWCVCMQSMKLCLIVTCNCGSWKDGERNHSMGSPSLIRRSLSVLGLLESPVHRTPHAVITLTILVHSHFRVSSPDYSLHSEITQVITVLEWQSLMWIPIVFITWKCPFQFWNNVNNCSVQCAIGLKTLKLCTPEAFSTCSTNAG